MAQQLSPDVVYHSYALLRRGQHKWDGWYDVLQANGRPLRTFVRVPSREGFDDPEIRPFNQIVDEVQASVPVRVNHGVG